MGPVDSPDRIEPTMLDPLPSSVADAVAELAVAASALGRALHPKTAVHLANTVRIMNTYYSNVIEGHDTRPREIERALAGHLDPAAGPRALQIEAVAHVRIQADIDRRAAAGELPEPASRDFVLELHRAFYHGAADEMLAVGGRDRTYRMIPGAFRSAPDQDVAVGRLVPPSSPMVDAFMRAFAERYRLAPLGASARLVAFAAAHHRFNYIHPFPDGNGRVSRLMSHAMAHVAGVGANGLWSISRGLARGLDSRSDYRRMMDHADTPRQGDLDGRGNLSQRALIDFVVWFLHVAIDQVTFMRGLFDLEALRGGLRRYVSARAKLAPQAFDLLAEILIRGEVARGDAGRITRLPDRTARRVLQQLVAEGILASDTPKGAVSLRFPAHALDELFPRLYALA